MKGGEGHLGWDGMSDSTTRGCTSAASRVFLTSRRTEVLLLQQTDDPGTLLRSFSIACSGSVVADVLSHHTIEMDNSLSPLLETA